MKWAALLLACAAGCSGPTLTQAQLMDPAECMRCHPDHYQQWSASMHAYAADDPIFRAMNARGQRETKGALGSFCVNCHAPLAVRMGATTDGLNLDQVPADLKGVSCYFCHSVAQVTGDHNNPLILAKDRVLRAGIPDPVSNTAHYAGYAALLDRQQVQSATLCGSCHDIVNPLGTAIERTFHEWQGTVYDSMKAEQLQTCGKCHMSGHQGLAAQAPGVLVRTVHDHSFAAIDMALTPFAGMDAQRQGIDTLLATAAGTKLCVTAAPNHPGTGQAVVTLDNVAIGHGLPSGSGQDRRVWLELVAYKGGQVIYKSGQLAATDDVAAAAAKDPDLWLFRDTMKDAAGAETHNFWDAASDTSVELPPQVTNDPSDPRYFHALMKSYALPVVPDKVTIALHERPVGLDVIEDLVQSGDLDAATASSLIAAMPTLDFSGAALEWDAANRADCVPVQ